MIRRITFEIPSFGTRINLISNNLNNLHCSNATNYFKGSKRSFCTSHASETNSISSKNSSGNEARIKKCLQRANATNFHLPTHPSVMNINQAHGFCSIDRFGSTSPENISRFYSQQKLKPRFSTRLKDRLIDQNEVPIQEREALKLVNQERESFIQFLEQNKRIRGPIKEFFSPSHCSFKNCCRKWGSTRSVCEITGEKMRSDPPFITRIFEKDPEDYYFPRSLIAISVILFFIINIRFVILWFHGNHPNQIRRREIEERLKKVGLTEESGKEAAKEVESS